MKNLVVFTPVDLGRDATNLLNFGSLLPVPADMQPVEVVKAVFDSLAALYGIAEPDWEVQNPIQLNLLPEAINNDKVDTENHFLATMQTIRIHLEEGRLSPKKKKDFCNNLVFKHTLPFAMKSSLFLLAEIVMQHFFKESLFFFVRNGVATPYDNGKLLKEFLSIPCHEEEQERSNVLLFEMISRYLQNGQATSVDFSILGNHITVSHPDKILSQLKEAAGIYDECLDFDILKELARYLAPPTLH